MAFDSLQAPATIINNDKLISMAGNLMAKKKAEKDAYSKIFIQTFRIYLFKTSSAMTWFQ
jgi:hypothetical protein